MFPKFVEIKEASLSDGSKVYALHIKGENGNTAAFECVDYERAYSAFMAIQAHLEASVIAENHQ